MRGLGFAHACDRIAQMTLVRLIGQGRLCECLSDSEESLAVDIFIRRQGFTQLARDEVDRLAPETREMAEAYSAGVNDYLENHSLPWGLRLAGCRPEPWEPADSLLTVLMMSYVGLAQTQQDVEKFLIQLIHDGCDLEKLKRLYAPHLDAVDAELVELIRGLSIVEPLVPPLPDVLPRITSSNAWAVAPARSASGNALQCNDPHLECARLPAIWYEVVMKLPDDYQIGITMPGVPGLIMGRNRNLSAGFTYGFMDMIDYFIEECRGGKYFRESGDQSFRVRKETILRRKHAPVEIRIFENEHGLLECDPHAEAVPDGRYLVRAFSSKLGGTARSLDVLARWPQAKSVAEAQRIVREASISCNWVLADRNGNIGYQQSGLLPARQHSGLHPVPGWKRESAWRGLVPADQLASEFNPPDGIICSANEDRQRPGAPLAINLSQGPYRSRRIRELLEAGDRHTLDGMRAMQRDLFSVQARRFMEILRPLLPDTAAGRILSKWDLLYDAASVGATLFEAFYSKLLETVFGDGLFGRTRWEAFANSTNLLVAYFQRFDEALLSDDPVWFEGRTRDEVFAAVAASVLSDSAVPHRPWGDVRQVMMKNLLFGGKLPPWLNRLAGVDYGPIVLPGNRSTLVQGAIFNSHGRLATFAPSYRFITDLGTDEVATALAGGPSERVFSGMYSIDVPRWLAGEYKRLSGTD
jgi:penicillin amidase